MKRKLTIVMIVLGMAGFSQAYQAYAQSPSPTPPANATMTEQTPFAKEMPKMVTPLNLPPATKESSMINRAGGTSSQPWAQIAAHEQLNDGFPNSQTPEPKFDLLSISWGPKY